MLQYCNIAVSFTLYSATMSCTVAVSFTSVLSEMSSLQCCSALQSYRTSILLYLQLCCSVVVSFSLYTSVLHVLLQCLHIYCTSVLSKKSLLQCCSALQSYYASLLFEMNALKCKTFGASVAKQKVTDGSFS